jgi:hypothetical protein
MSAALTQAQLAGKTLALAEQSRQRMLRCVAAAAAARAAPVTVDWSAVALHEREATNAAEATGRYRGLALAMMLQAEQTEQERIKLAVETRLFKAFIR